MKSQVKPRKSLPFSDFLNTSVGTLLKRLIILLLLCTLFVAAAMYIPEKVTYEEVQERVSSTQNGEQSVIPTDTMKKSSALADSTSEEKESTIMIVKFCEDDGSVCVFEEDGTKKGVIKLSSGAVTVNDLVLLKDGIALTGDEFCELLGQLEAEFLNNCNKVS